MGPQVEWFVRYLDGSWRPDNMPDWCAERMRQIQAQGGDILQMHFGEDDTWAIIYSH